MIVKVRAIVASFIKFSVLTLRFMARTKRVYAAMKVIMSFDVNITERAGLQDVARERILIRRKARMLVWGRSFGKVFGFLIMIAKSIGRKRKAMRFDGHRS